jgi:long-chain fatty acid transport protein
VKRQLMFAAAVLVLVPSLSWGAGFALFETGSKALGMGGAFTAVADDPSAFFWNPAGMAFQIDEGTQVMAGVIFIAPYQDFTGADPYPGAGYSASLKDQVFFPPPFYWVKPLSDRVNFSLGFITPFGLGTWWDQEDFAGRFISKRSDLMVFDLGGQVSWKACEHFAIGGGIDYMTATIELKKNVPFINPYTQSIVDVAEADLKSKGFSNNAWAWNVGFMLKLGAGFSIGGVYRSDFTVKGTSAEAEFTQIPTGYADLDATIAATIPFDEKPSVYTELNFPDFWQLGIAWSNEKFTLSGQYGTMGWNVFQELAIEFPDYPYLNSAVREDYMDSDQYRFGAEWRASQRWAFRLGYGFDETPQPVESMSPLLADGDRDFYSAGIGFLNRNSTWGFDVGYEYLTMGERSTEGRSYDGYDGTFHDAGASLFGVSFYWKF